MLFALLITVISFAQNSPHNTPHKANSIDDVSLVTVCYDYPDHDAYFSHGNEGFSKKVEDAVILHSVKFKKGEKTLKAILIFTVEKDGTITEIKVDGTNKTFNNEVKKAAKQVKGKWVLGKKNGSLVKSEMQIPIVINSH